MKCGDCALFFEEENRCLSGQGIYEDGECRIENDAKDCPGFMDRHDPKSRETLRRIGRYINIGE